MPLLEPAVALTDLGLAFESAIFAALLARRACNAVLQRWFMVFFSSLALAALMGFVSHGFIADKASGLHTAVWATILLAIGTVALAAWAVGARLLWPAATALRVTRAAAMLGILYVAVVLAGYRFFVTAIVFYLPATLFLLTALVIHYRRTPAAHLLAGVFGMLLTFVAVVVQQARIALHPMYFDHNALYHLIQAVALLLVYLAARGLLRSESPA
jgi:hypothetical protein